MFQIDMTTPALNIYIITKETHELLIEENNTSTQEDIEYQFPQGEPLISLNALSNISTSQTLKFMSYNKHKKFIVLVDSGSTHNFIHKRVVEETHYFAHNFQIMISNGGMMKCGEICETFKLHVGDYHLKTHLFSIDMGVF